MNDDTQMETCVETTEASAATVQTPVIRKWLPAAGLGPRQAKVFNDALKSASWAAKEVVEITGIIGKPETENRFGFVQIFGGPTHPEYAAKLAAIGDKHAWTVGPTNYRAIEADFHALTAWLKANPMINDKRETAEDAAERKHQLAETIARQAAERAAVHAKEAAEQDGARAKYPWAKRDASHQANGAANMRRLLNGAFPGVVFRFKSDSFSGGSSIDVSWENGPTPGAVKRISDQFQDSDFDGMQDMSISRDDGEGFRAWMGYAKYVSENRHVSDEIRAAVRAGLEARRMFGEWENKDQVLDRETWQLLNKTAIPAGATVASVTFENDTGYVINFTVPEAAPSAAPVVSAAGVTVSENEALDGVEVRFPAKPAQSVIETLKSHGFRWAGRNGCWYHKRTPRHIEFAYSLAVSV